MTDTTSNNSKPKSNRKKIIIFSTVGLFVITIALAFILPFTVSDGTEKFSGKEKEIAKQAIGDGSYDGPHASPTLDLPVPFRIKAIKMHKIEPGKACGPTGHTPGVTYIVEVDRITFFGMQAPGYDVWTCVFDE